MRKTRASNVFEYHCVTTVKKKIYNVLFEKIN